MIRKVIVILALFFSATAWAGDLEDAWVAYNKKEYTTAIEIFKKLANQDNATAQGVLGLLYAHGDVVLQDYAESVHWLKLSAAQGINAAQSKLGSMYGDGTGVPQDYVRAHMWSNLASAKGNMIAKVNRDFYKTKMTPQQIAEAQKLARECQARNYKNCD